MGSGTSSAVASAITIQLNEAQPFMAGQNVTGTVAFSNTFEKSITLQRIYVELVGDAIHMTKQYNGSGYYYVTHRDSLFRQSINLQENQDGFTLDRDHCSWPVSFSLPGFLPPSLNQLATHGPYIRYKIRVFFERPEKYKTNVHRSFPIIVVARPSLHPYPSFLTLEAENKNRSDVSLHAALTDQNDPLTPGDSFLLDVELHNPKHLTVKSLPIDLIQHRSIWNGGNCSLIIPLVELPHMHEFSGEYYHETLKMTIPDDDRIISAFYYMPPTSSGKPITVEYTIKLEVKMHGFFTNFILNIPIALHSKEKYIEISMEEDLLSSPPPYNSVVEKQ